METNSLDKQEKKQHIPEPAGALGFGGWLILPQIGFVISVVSLFLFFVKELPDVLDSSIWGVLGSKDSSLYDPLFAPMVITEVVWNLVLVIGTLVTIVLFYRRKRIVPKLMITLYLASLVGMIVSYVFVQQIPVLKEAMADGSQIREIGRYVVTCVIWVPYFLLSQRVENTFIK
ncbi:hypothetical protein DNH61_25090 [Paenibacillus sambharensis]|uniref:DUF2569 domain-containing protein n=1 Tax=Paenibacillus sambharensis TaxID=1803190 RepID=A0A2W1L4F1_9BACL|nr:DUF2569 domain-containing protein [Paenibacillus sambharensis]PZD93060.1 hypothetical protein DNH61_25090 [Paenibacillus sambharensis]